MTNYPYPKVKLFGMIFNNITENIARDEGALSRDLAKSLKRIIVTGDKNKYLDSLTSYVKKSLYETTDDYLPEPLLVKAARETAEAAYKDFIEHLEREKLPAEILEAWSKVKLQDQEPEYVPLTNPRLFNNSNITPLPTPPLMMSSIKAQIKKPGWTKDESGIAFYQHLGKQPRQVIEHYISPSSSVGDISLLPWSEAWQIIDKFSFTTAKVHLLFAGHCMNQEKPWSSLFTLKASDIVKEIGWDKRHDLPKSQLLKEVASAAYTLDCLLVRAEWETGKAKKGKIPVKVDISRFWNVSFKYDGQKDLSTGEVENPKEIYITVQPGLWTKSFLNTAGAVAREALYQFGYISQEVLKIDPYHDELALRLAIYLTLESRYHQSGRYKVGTLLRNILPGAEMKIAEARSNFRSGYDLKQRWDNALKLLTSLEWQIIYDSETYSEYLQPGSKQRNPKGYWDKLLGARIEILPPLPIPSLLGTVGQKLPKLKTASPSPAPLTGVAISKARKAKKWSQRKLAGFLGISQSLLAMIEKGKRTPQPEVEAKIRELLDIND